MIAMKRVVNILICLVASLFLITARGECCEILEQGHETETECCVMSGSIAQATMTVTAHERAGRPDFPKSDVFPFHKSYARPQECRAVMAPVRILCCVFRE